MPKDTKTLCIKKGCASVLTQPLAEGHRFDDLKRWYSPSEIQLIFKANGKQGAENFQEKHLYYPIPTSELNNNTAMEQTSLWK